MSKQTDQILENGAIVEGCDQIITRKSIYESFVDIFKTDCRKDRNQYVLYGKIGVLAANVTYLGNPHPINKKRMQLKKYYQDYVKENKNKNLFTIFVGIYTYEKTRLYVVFEPWTYVLKDLNNSSAHVYSANLQSAQREGKFFKIDRLGNKIHIFNAEFFEKYVKSLIGRGAAPSTYENIMELLKGYMATFLQSLPKEWNGVESYREMSANNYGNVKQNRWPGWYFEYKFQKYLETNPTEEVSWNSDKTKGGVDLDVKFPMSDWIYGDLKADRLNEDILGNKFATFDNVINDHDGVVYYICVRYKAERDIEHGCVTAKEWNSYRDKEKQYKNEAKIEKAAKSMPYSVKIERINILRIDKANYEELKKHPFFQGHNPNGKYRKPKLKVKKDLIEQYTVGEMDLKTDDGKTPEWVWRWTFQ